MVFQASDPRANHDRLFRNNCDGTFENVTYESGFYAGGDHTLYRPALAFIGAHLDRDLWPDMYVVNASPTSFTDHVDLRSKNTQGMFNTFGGSDAGIGDDAMAGMGIDVADIDSHPGNNATRHLFAFRQRQRQPRATSLPRTYPAGLTENALD